MMVGILKLHFPPVCERGKERGSREAVTKSVSWLFSGTLKDMAVELETDQLKKHISLLESLD